MLNSFVDLSLFSTTTSIETDFQINSSEGIKNASVRVPSVCHQFAMSMRLLV